MIIDKAQTGVQRLDGKVAIVTGAGRGIGRETARVLAHLGAAVIIAELSEEGRETEGLICREDGRALFIHTDVSNEDSVANLHGQVMAAFGKVDILINNATVFTVGPLWKLPVSEWDRLMAVNLRGAFLCIRACLPDMLARKEGVVVTMESAEGMPYLAPYLASKVALRSLAGSLAQEVGEDSGVSVFCYGPGMVPTPGLNSAIERLAPLYGMNRDQFIAQSSSQLVDTEVCATGLVGAILHAHDYHGEEIGFAMGLTKLGLNGAGDPVTSPPLTPVTPSMVTVQSLAPYADGMAQVLELNQELEEILRDNVREYDELTLFQRPIVKRMFQSGTGLKVDEWLDNAQAMSRQLERHHSDTPAAWQALSDPEVDQYVAQLKRLAQFILKQESDARGFFKNQEALDRALEALRARRGVVNRLIAVLEEKMT